MKYASNQFLEGLFQHTAHCRDFVTKTGGVERLSRLYTLPCLPTNFSDLPAAHSLIAVVRTMAEAVPALTLERLTKLVKESLDETRSIWQPPENASPDIASLMEVKGKPKRLTVASNSDDGLMVSRYRRCSRSQSQISPAGHTASSHASTRPSVLDRWVYSWAFDKYYLADHKQH